MLVKNTILIVVIASFLPPLCFQGAISFSGEEKSKSLIFSTCMHIFYGTLLLNKHFNMFSVNNPLKSKLCNTLNT